MTDNAIPFYRGAVEPIACLKAGWGLVKDNYWLFVGMSFMAVFIGSVVPFGILLGPMMCGLYLALFKKRRGEPIEFGILFRGFDYFGQSLIATLIHMIPVFVLIVPTYIAFYAGMLLMIQQSGNQPNPTVMLSFMGTFLIVWLIVIVLITIISILFTFTYPLIVDRGLSGVDAVKLSAKAAWTNFWRLLGLFFLNGILSLGGALLCYVGLFFVFPITFGALLKAYEQVFGLGAPIVNAPPPPPTFH